MKEVLNICDVVEDKRSCISLKSLYRQYMRFHLDSGVSPSKY